MTSLTTSGRPFPARVVRAIRLRHKEGIKAALAAGCCVCLWLSTSDPIPNNSFVIDTAGAKGTIAGSDWTVSLPLVVENGFDYPIHQIEMTVELYGCASPAEPFEECERITSFSEYYSKDVPAWSRVSQLHERSGKVKSDSGATKRFLKIKSNLFSMVDARSLEDEAEQERLENLTFP